MRRVFAAALLSSAFAAPALAGGVSVPMDEVRLVAFKEPVTTVFMGNSMIADVNMIDARHAFILGKTMGETNMIALGANGRQVADDHVNVVGRRVGAVTLNRGGQQYNYSCTHAHCETQPIPGDNKPWFDETHNAISEHQDLGVKAASVAGGGTPGQAQ